MLLIVFISNIFVAAKVKDTNLHIVRTVPEVAIKNTQGLIWMLYTFDSNLLTKIYNWRWFPLYNTIRESCFYSCIKQAVGHRSACIIWVTSFSVFVLFIIFFFVTEKKHISYEDKIFVLKGNLIKILEICELNGPFLFFYTWVNCLSVGFNVIVALIAYSNTLYILIKIPVFVSTRIYFILPILT